MKVQPNKNISLKKGTVSVFGVLLAFHCCYYGDIHWERRVRIGWREPGRTEWHHTLRRSSSLSSSSRFLFAAVLLPWLRPEERGLLLFLFLSDSSRRPTRSSSLSSWNERLLWAFESNGCNHCYHERLRGYQRKRQRTDLQEGAAMSRRVLSESWRFYHTYPGDTQHLVLAVVILIVQRERPQTLCIHRLGRDVTVALVILATVQRRWRCGRSIDLLHQPFHLLLSSFFICADLSI